MSGYLPTRCDALLPGLDCGEMPAISDHCIKMRVFAERFEIGILLDREIGCRVKRQSRTMQWLISVYACFSGVVRSIGFGVTPDADVIGSFEPGLPDVQRTLNWARLASGYSVRVRVENPPSDLFRVSESAVVLIRGR